MDDETRPPPGSDPGADYSPLQDDSSATVLDLTSFQLHDLESVELPACLTELDLTANRLSTLDPRIGQLSNLTKLSFRQNLIKDDAVEPISRWDALSGLEVFNIFLLNFSSSLVGHNHNRVIDAFPVCVSFSWFSVWILRKRFLFS